MRARSFSVLLLRNLLYKLCIKKKISPRWINDLHSRFIVWANMKYFSFLIWFRLSSEHTSFLYMFKCFVSVSVLFGSQFVYFPQHKCILFLGAAWPHGYSQSGKKTTQSLWVRAQERVCAFKWTMKIRFLRFNVSVLCRIPFERSRISTRYYQHIVIFIQNLDINWHFMSEDANCLGHT